MFSVLSVVLTFLIYIYYAGIHGFPSRFSTRVGATAPRYVMSFLGLYILILYLLGLMRMAWAPVLFAAVAMQAFGSVALMLDWYLGERVEPYSLVAFMFDALSACTLWCAVVVDSPTLVPTTQRVAREGETNTAVWAGTLCRSSGARNTTMGRSRVTVFHGCYVSLQAGK